MAAGMGGQAAGLPPGAEAELAALMGMGGDPAAAMDPAMMGAAPAMGGAMPIPGLPSTDPAMIAQLQQQDIAMVQAAQAAAAQEATAMSTAAAGMGGMPPAAPAAMGAPPLGGDAFAPQMTPLADPAAGTLAGYGPIPPELAGAFGGPGFGGLESENVGPIDDEFAGTALGY